MGTRTPLSRFAIALAVVPVALVTLSSCGAQRTTVGSGPPASQTTGRVPAPAGRAQALQACHTWAAAGKGSGASQLSDHADQAAAATEATRAAAAATNWRSLARAMEGSVHLPVAMLTPRQESEAASDLATIRHACGRLGIAISS